MYSHALRSYTSDPRLGLEPNGYLVNLSSKEIDSAASNRMLVVPARYA